MLVPSSSVCRYGPNVPASLSPTMYTSALLAADGGPVSSGAVSGGTVDSAADTAGSVDPGTVGSPVDATAPVGSSAPRTGSSSDSTLPTAFTPIPTIATTITSATRRRIMNRRRLARRRAFDADMTPQRYEPIGPQPGQCIGFHAIPTGRRFRGDELNRRSRRGDTQRHL